MSSVGQRPHHHLQSARATSVVTPAAADSTAPCPCLLGPPRCCCSPPLSPPGALMASLTTDSEGGTQPLNSGLVGSGNLRATALMSSPTPPHRRPRGRRNNARRPGQEIGLWFLNRSSAPRSIAGSNLEAMSPSANP